VLSADVIVILISTAADVEFLTKLHIMDYSLLLGVHNCDSEDQEIDTIPEGDELEEEEYDSGGSGVALTPPDSPLANRQVSIPAGANGSRIDPEKDIYAIPSRATSQNREIYFLAIVDILTHYGVKKQAAKVAKTVKYGSSVDGISTVEPDQYAKRFLEFIGDGIE
jgi:1-phosphatidylinositol-5-phosphate 4-kinase